VWSYRGESWPSEQPGKSRVVSGLSLLSIYFASRRNKRKRTKMLDKIGKDSGLSPMSFLRTTGVCSCRLQDFGEPQASGNPGRDSGTINPNFSRATGLDSFP